jgi:hypothetical protein
MSFLREESAREASSGKISASSWRDLTLTGKDGLVLNLSWTMVHLSDGTSIGIGQDITQRKRAEAVSGEQRTRIETRNQRLEQAMRESDHQVKNNLSKSGTTDRAFLRRSAPLPPPISAWKWWRVSAASIWADGRPMKTARKAAPACASPFPSPKCRRRWRPERFSGSSRIRQPSEQNGEGRTGGRSERLLSAFERPFRSLVRASGHVVFIARRIRGQRLQARIGA